MHSGPSSLITPSWPGPKYEQNMALSGGCSVAVRTAGGTLPQPKSQGPGLSQLDKLSDTQETQLWGKACYFAQLQPPCSLSLVGGPDRVPRTHRGIIRRPREEDPLKALGIPGVQAEEKVAGLLRIQQRQHGPVIVSVPTAHWLPRSPQHELLWGQRPGERSCRRPPLLPLTQDG